MEVSFENFFLSTEAVFKGCKRPKRKPDYVSYTKDQEYTIVSSCYWYGTDKKGSYVIRESNHWTKLKQIGNNLVVRDCFRIGSCQWGLKTNSESLQLNPNKVLQRVTLLGKCHLSDFKILE